MPRQNSFTVVHALKSPPEAAELERILKQAGGDVMGHRNGGRELRISFQGTPTHFARFMVLRPPPDYRAGARRIPCLLFNCDHDGETRAYLRGLLLEPGFRSALHRVYSHCEGYGDWLEAAPGRDRERGIQDFIDYLLGGITHAAAEHRGYWGVPVEKVREGERAIRTGRRYLDALAEGPRAGPRSPMETADGLREFLLSRGISPYRVSWTVNFLPRLTVEIARGIFLVPAGAAAFVFRKLRIADRLRPIGAPLLGLSAFLASGFRRRPGLATAGGLAGLLWLVLRRRAWAVRAARIVGVLLLIALLPLLFFLLLDQLVRWLNREEDGEARRNPGMIPRPREVWEELEDRKFQNQMTHLTVIRPRRAAILRLVLPAVHFLGVGYFPAGTLGGITTIHFARWINLDDETLLFLSNYDGSWESYLGDFVGKAALGLSGVWSNTGRFPRSFFAFPGRWIEGGARHELEFKAWARQYQQETQYWYSAFPNLSVRNIRDGLRCLELLGRRKFSPKEAEAWLALF